MIAMKRILITGADSYVGTNVERWLMRDPENYQVFTIDMKDPDWKLYDFNGFDVVFHVAGIAHVSYDDAKKDLYLKINRDLALEVANKAKISRVPKYIFMSSMIIYSSKETHITFETEPKPDNHYGLSKLLAEKELEVLNSEDFEVVIIRPPMIYGPNSKGNFPKLVKLAKRLPVFPLYTNKRSMLYIDNLANVVKGIVDNELSGILFPQNSDYVCTHQIFRNVRAILNKKTLFLRVFNPFISLLKNRVVIINKMFSDSYYDNSLSEKTEKYCVVDFYDGIAAILEEDTVQ